jgi:hypothetical protein
MKKLLLVLLVLAWPGPARADAVIDWNETAASAAFAAGLENSAGCVDGLHESRIFAMVHVAIHDALNAIDRRYQPYAFDGQASEGASPEAAVAARSSLSFRVILASPQPQPSTSSKRPTPRRSPRFQIALPRPRGS